MSRPVLLIGGTGRSGTTILGRIFSKHSWLTDVPETRYLVDPDGIISFYQQSKVTSPYGYDVAYRRMIELLIRTNNRFGKSKYLSGIERRLYAYLPRKITAQYNNLVMGQISPNFTHFINQLEKKLIPDSFKGSWVGMKFGSEKRIHVGGFDENVVRDALQEFLRNVFDDVIKCQNKQLFLEKNTWNILFFPEILELIPEAKIVHIKRDLRDVVSSFVHQSWMPTEVNKSARILRSLVERWEENRRVLPPSSYLEITLEELVAEPESVLKEICFFWEIPFEKSLLDMRLSSGSLGRWRKDLSQEDQNKVMAVLQEYIKSDGNK